MNGPNLWLRGIVNGIIAGVIFVMFEMLWTVLAGNPVLMPVKMMSSLVLGKAAMAPAYPLTTAVVVAVIVHMMISAVWGVIFTYLLAGFVGLRRSQAAVIGNGLILGLLVWVFNFYIVAPLLWPWFGAADPLQQFVAHTLFFGGTLGLLAKNAAAPSSSRRAL